MHPLSWNVYGGHVESVKLLLESGAQVNADVDSGDGSGSKITVLDTCTNFLDSNPNEEGPLVERFRQVHQLLLQHGAKKYAEL
jgi:ankyrin repeat protein